MAKFVIASPATEQPVVLTLETDSLRHTPERAEINVMATFPSGRKVKIIGLSQRSNGKISTYRWGGYRDEDEVKQYFSVSDSSGRISDLFNE